MPTDRDGEESVDRLRAKYAQLAAKYAALVERLDRRTQRNTAVFRLGWFGVHASGGAMALVEADKVTLANPGWRRLVARRGPWIVRAQEESPARRYADLPSLALGEARAALQESSGVLVSRADSADRAMSLEIKAEALSTRDARVIVLATDVTDAVHREAELLRTREALLEKEHLRVLGELTTSVTHDLGSTLRAIQARLEVLADEPQLAPRRAVLASLSHYVRAALDRLRELHRLARSGRLTPVPVDLADVVEQAATVLHVEKDPDRIIKLEVKLDDVPPVIGTPAELSHLFMTLLRNAKDAMPNGGAISVVSRRRPGSIIVCVRDQGPGISAAVMPHLFEPFFTTKADSGTGLGLWLAASTMRRLGGSIRAVNRRSGGAEFVLQFPVASRRRVTRRAKARPAPPARRAGRVPA